jgi:phosphoribosylaminoimidazole (AIR) synthetase
MSTKSKYAQDGVDVEQGDSFSEFAGNLCRATYKNSPYVEVMDFSHSHFRGPRGFRFKGLPRVWWQDVAPDGDGTKGVLVDAARDYINAAYGWVAMTCGDISRWGGIPLLLTNNLDVESLGKLGDPVNKAFRNMLLGLKKIADDNNLVMYKGETAELPGSVTSSNVNALIKYLWAGVAVGAYNPKTVITGDKVRQGMSVMALRERGFRNNGISSARKAIMMHFDGSYQHPDAKIAVKKAAAPAVLYDRFLAMANGWLEKDFKPIIPRYLSVHLTGGAIKSKLAEDILFPRGLSAHLDNLWEPAEIMKDCAKWRGMTDEECYETWNGGQGSLDVIDSSNERAFIELASDFGIEARCVGEIAKKKNPSVAIESKFSNKTIEWFAK